MLPFAGEGGNRKNHLRNCPLDELDPYRFHAGVWVELGNRRAVFMEILRGKGGAKKNSEANQMNQMNQICCSGPGDAFDFFSF